MVVKSEHGGEGVVTLQGDAGAPVPVSFQLLTTFRKSKEWLDGIVSPHHAEDIPRIAGSTGGILRMPCGNEVEFRTATSHQSPTIPVQWKRPTS